MRSWIRRHGIWLLCYPGMHLGVISWYHFSPGEQEWMRQPGEMNAREKRYYFQEDTFGKRKLAKRVIFSFFLSRTACLQQFRSGSYVCWVCVDNPEVFTQMERIFVIMIIAKCLSMNVSFFALNYLGGSYMSIT